jgi:hypothetical protein
MLPTKWRSILMIFASVLLMSGVAEARRIQSEEEARHRSDDDRKVLQPKPSVHRRRRSGSDPPKITRSEEPTWDNEARVVSEVSSDLSFDSIDNLISAEISDAVQKQIDAQLDESIRDALNMELQDALDRSIDEQIESELETSMENAIRRSSFDDDDDLDESDSEDYEYHDDLTDESFLEELKKEQRHNRKTRHSSNLLKQLNLWQRFRGR